MKPLTTLVIACALTLLPAKSFAQEQTHSFRKNELGVNMLQMEALDGDELYFAPGIFYRFHFLERFQLRLSANHRAWSYLYDYNEHSLPNLSTPGIAYQTGKYNTYELRFGCGGSVIAKKRFSLYGFAEWGLRITTHNGRYGYNGVDYEDDYSTTAIGASFGPGANYNVWKGLTFTYEADWTLWLRKTNYSSQNLTSSIHAWTEFFPVSTLGASWRF